MSIAQSSPFGDRAPGGMNGGAQYTTGVKIFLPQPAQALPTKAPKGSSSSRSASCAHMQAPGDYEPVQ